MIGNNDVVAGNVLPDYSFISVNQNKGLIARCVTGLGPSGNRNSNLGRWYFNESQIPYGGCNNNNNNNNVIQAHGSNITRAVGVINLRQCRPLTTSAEGVYWCMVMNSSMMYEVKRLGVYLSGRSKLSRYLHVYYGSFI